MDGSLHFRPGVPQDRPALEQLSLAAYRRFADVLSPGDYATLESFLLDEKTWDYLFDRAICFVCEKNGDIVGMAFLLPNGNPSQLFEPGCAQLRMVGVHPGAAGKGIGRKLTQMAIEYARQSGEKTLALHTTEFMGAARHIYKILGFKVFRELEPLYGMGNWIYRLDL